MIRLEQYHKAVQARNARQAAGTSSNKIKQLELRRQKRQESMERREKRHEQQKLLRKQKEEQREKFKLKIENRNKERLKQKKEEKDQKHMEKDQKQLKKEQKQLEKEQKQLEKEQKQEEREQRLLERIRIRESKKEEKAAKKRDKMPGTKSFKVPNKYKKVVSKDKVKQMPRPGQKDYYCPKCSLVLNHHKIAERHYLIVHERKYPFFCAECNVGLPDRRDVRKHIVRFHNLKPGDANSWTKTNHICNVDFSKPVKGLHPIISENCDDKPGDSSYEDLEAVSEGHAESSQPDTSEPPTSEADNPVEEEDSIGIEKVREEKPNAASNGLKEPEGLGQFRTDNVNLNKKILLDSIQFGTSYPVEKEKNTIPNEKVEEKSTTKSFDPDGLAQFRTDDVDLNKQKPLDGLQVEASNLVEDEKDTNDKEKPVDEKSASTIDLNDPEGLGKTMTDNVNLNKEKLLDSILLEQPIETSEPDPQSNGTESSDVPLELSDAPSSSSTIDPAPFAECEMEVTQDQAKQTVKNNQETNDIESEVDKDASTDQENIDQNEQRQIDSSRKANKENGAQEGNQASTPRRSSRQKSQEGFKLSKKLIDSGESEVDPEADTDKENENANTSVDQPETRNEEASSNAQAPKKKRQRRSQSNLILDVIGKNDKTVETEDSLKKDAAAAQIETSTKTYSQVVDAAVLNKEASEPSTEEAETSKGERKEAETPGEAPKNRRQSRRKSQIDQEAQKLTKEQAAKAKKEAAQAKKAEALAKKQAKKEEAEAKKLAKKEAVEKKKLQAKAEKAAEQAKKSAAKVRRKSASKTTPGKSRLNSVKAKPMLLVNPEDEYMDLEDLIPATVCKPAHSGSEPYTEVSDNAEVFKPSDQEATTDEEFINDVEPSSEADEEREELPDLNPSITDSSDMEMETVDEPSNNKSSHNGNNQAPIMPGDDLEDDFEACIPSMCVIPKTVRDPQDN